MPVLISTDASVDVDRPLPGAAPTLEEILDEWSIDIDARDFGRAARRGLVPRVSSYRWRFTSARQQNGAPNHGAQYQRDGNGA